MPRVYRPHVPLSVRCAVAERQFLERFPAGMLLSFEAFRNRLGMSHSYANRLTAILRALAIHMGCEVSELRLDHDPPLAARPRRYIDRQGITKYTPDANDPDHLFYRPHGAQHAGSHDVKTRIRGDHGQLSDLALIKKARRYDPLTKNKPPKRKVKIRSRGFGKVSRPFHSPRIDGGPKRSK